MDPALQAVLVILVGVGGCVGYFYGSNLVLDKVIFPASAARMPGATSTAPIWCGRGCSCFPRWRCLGLYLAYPVFATAWLSLFDTNGDGSFVGFGNYSAMFAEPKFMESLTNNMLWLIVVPAASTAFGLVGRATDRPDQMGQYRQIADLHADGDFLCRCLGDLQADL